MGRIGLGRSRRSGSQHGQNLPTMREEAKDATPSPSRASSVSCLAGLACPFVCNVRRTEVPVGATPKEV